jgi:CRP-like cAMP-binding protein
MKQIPLLQEFSEADLAALSDIFLVRNLAPGEILFRELDPAASFFIIVSGIVFVYKEISHTVRQRIATLGRFRFLGEVTLIDGGVRTATTEAGSPLTVLECRKADFDLLFFTNNRFAFKVFDYIITDLSARVRAANHRLEELLANPGQTLSVIYDAFVEVGSAAYDTEESERPPLR